MLQRLTETCILKRAKYLVNSVVQYIAVWCNVLQCGAVFCSVLQCVAWLMRIHTRNITRVHSYSNTKSVAVCCSLLQSAAYCNTPQHTATHRNTSQHAATNCVRGLDSDVCYESLDRTWGFFDTVQVPFCIYRSHLQVSFHIYRSIFICIGRFSDVYRSLSIWYEGLFYRSLFTYIGLIYRSLFTYIGRFRYGMKDSFDRLYV